MSMHPDLAKTCERINSGAMSKMKIDPDSYQAIYFLGLAQAGEAGELANKVKKLWRDGYSDDRDDDLINDIRKEVADCLIYLHHICGWLGTTEDAVVAEKLAELKERWPQYFQD